MPKRERDPRPWWRRPVVWIWGTGSVIGAIVLVLMPKPDRGGEPDPEPTGNMELCQMLRDPEYDDWSTGTWERLTDWPEWKIRRYVADRCPEQIDRFL